MERNREATQRIPAPGPSFVKDEPVAVRTRDASGARLTAGMSAPSVMDDGWWLAHLWVADDAGIVSALELAPAAGPPPGTPLGTLGPRLAGALSGLIDQDEGRQLIRLRMPPAPDETRPWERPMLCMVAVRWDPVRAEVMSRNALARELLVGFAAAVEALGRPS